MNVNRPAKDMGITYLLWLFLGVLGAHKFYLNRPGMGIAYLLTLGFLGVGLLIDLFTIPAQVRRANAGLASPVQVNVYREGPLADFDWQEARR